VPLNSWMTQFPANLGARSQKCADIERALQRLALGRGGPRDLLAIADTLRECGVLKQALLRMCFRRRVVALILSLTAFYRSVPWMMPPRIWRGGARPARTATTHSEIDGRPGNARGPDQVGGGRLGARRRCGRRLCARWVRRPPKTTELYLRLAQQRIIGVIALIIRSSL